MIWAIARYDDPATEALVVRMVLQNLAEQGERCECRVPMARLIWPWRVA